MSGYAVGSALERQVKKDLEERGYWVVRAAGSKGPADLVALSLRSRGYESVLLVQVKRTRNPSIEAWCELWELARETWAMPIIAKKGKGRGEIDYKRILGPKMPREFPWETFVP